MTPKPSQCAHVENGKRCKVHAWKPGERYCIKHDIQSVIATGPLWKPHPGTQATSKPKMSRGHYAV